MKSINLAYLSFSECTGIQISGLNHCRNINCKWQGLSACKGKTIINTGRNQLGFRIGPDGLIPEDCFVNEKNPG